MNTTTESEQNASAPEVPQAKGKRKPTKKNKPANKGARTRKPAGKPNTERANKKAAVIAMMTSPASWRQLTQRSGWSFGEAETWLTASLTQLLLHSSR